jgi:hypothetical protein
MSWGEEQQKEIETIRERKITVKLSDADCDRLARKCGEHGLTIGELIENFVGDLVGGTYSNGSDERDYADQWFERCWFGMFPEPTLLNHLLNLGYEPEHYLDMLENVETIKSDIEITKQNIAEPSDEWKDIVYHKYNDDRTSYECVPCYNSVDEYIASEKEDLESYKADLEEALEELKDMINFHTANLRPTKSLGVREPRVWLSETKRKTPECSGVSFFRAGNSNSLTNAFHICVYVHLCVVPRYIASQHPWKQSQSLLQNTKETTAGHFRRSVFLLSGRIPGVHELLWKAASLSCGRYR